MGIGIRVLLIDDNPDDRALARRALEQEFPGLQAEEIREAAGLERALARGGFDAVITDFQLNWTDGLAVLRAVKARHPACPIVMFTGTGNEEVAVEAMKAGLDDYVIKTPRHYIRLPAALRGAIARAADRRARREAEAERDRLLELERQARAEAEAASLLKDEFLATLSHELRTPLNAIVGWVGLLRAGKLQGERFQRALESIERSARLQTRLIDDLLDVSAVITGRMRLEPQPVDLVEVTEEALESTRATADARSIRLDPELEPPGPVAGDPDRLRQMVWNLLSNAVKFTPEGGLVRVRLEKAGAHARLTVSDTGPGIPPAFLPYAFEPFRQADGSITRAQGGLGLGLALVRRLVELHGGTVRAENASPQGGAVFVVEVPLRAEPRTERPG